MSPNNDFNFINLLIKLYTNYQKFLQHDILFLKYFAKKWAILCLFFRTCERFHHAHLLADLNIKLNEYYRFNSQ